MSFTFYHSPFCPRCTRARRHLENLLGKPLPDTIILVDILKHPAKTWQDGIRMIPALKSEQSVITGITLSPKRIKTFLDRHGVDTFSDKNAE